MPNKCCVPMCTSGYLRKGIVTEKIAMFSTKDPKMQKKWMKFIPRKNYVVSAKSRVCAHHFSECDIDKGYFIEVGGEKIFKQHKRWKLKPGAIPKIFPNCRSHMTKVKSSRRKKKLDDIEEPVSKEIKVCMQPEGKTVTIVTTVTDFTDSDESEEAADNAQDMPLTPNEHIDWETEIGKFTFPSNWSYTMQSDEFHIFKLGKDQQRMLEVERCLVLCNGIVSYKLKKAVVPQNNELLPSLITSVTMLRNVIKVFDEIEVCGGVTVSHLHSENVVEKLKQVEFNEGYED